MTYRRKHCVPVLDGIAAHYRIHIFRLCKLRIGSSLGLAIMLKHILTLKDVVLTVYILEPCIDFILGLS